MKRLELLRLSLRNFKGARKFDLKPNGRDLIICGDNATGKTTIVDAESWLLFGKDSANRADFDIKTLDEHGEPMHNAEHSVEAEFRLADGRTLTLKRTFKEKYAKPRGKSKREFTGHETLFEVDGVPASKKEFDARVAGIADEKRFRLLSDPLYFNTVLHWTDRRTMLFDAIGDVSDADVIASNDELSELEQILDGRSITDFRKIADAKKKAINKELEQLPVRIDELRESMPSLPTGDRAGFEESIEAARKMIAEAHEQRAEIQAGGTAGELRRQISEISSRMSERLSTLRSDAERAAAEARQSATAAETRADQKERERRRLDTELQDVEKRHSTAVAERDRLRAEFNAKRDEQPPAPTTEAVCPTCGQPLRSEQIDEANRKAVEQFNAAKAKRLNEIRERGHAAAAQVERLESQIADLRTAVHEATEDAGLAAAEATAAREEANQLTSAVPTGEDDDELKQLGAETERLRAQIESADAGKSEALAEVDAQIREHTESLRLLESDLAKFDEVDRAEKRIAEHTERETELAGDFEEVERHLYLLDQFTRAKVELLTERINARFKLARFKLFDEQINEGIKETCVTTYNGVPFESLNHGARLNVGLDIINTLTEQFGFTPPVFIDNAESVTSILPTRGQAIKLVVSAADKTMRVEDAQPAEAKA